MKYEPLNLEKLTDIIVALEYPNIKQFSFQNNECKGCPVFEDGIKSKHMCEQCDLWVEEKEGENGKAKSE